MGAKNSKIHIGVKFRPNECPQKSKQFDRLTVHYSGWLYKDNSEFDSSRKRKPFTFTLGTGQVIKGWDLGLLDMCVDEVRKIVIPSGLGYGDFGQGVLYIQEQHLCLMWNSSRSISTVLRGFARTSYDRTTVVISRSASSIY